MKKCVILGDGSKRTLTPPTYFQGSQDPLTSQDLRPGIVELSQIWRHKHSYDATDLNSTQFNWPDELSCVESSRNLVFIASDTTELN